MNHKKTSHRFITFLLSFIMCISYTSCTVNGMEETIEIDPLANELLFDPGYQEEDYDETWNDATATQITLKDNASTVNGSGASINGNLVTIYEEGTYVLTGTLSDGQVVVDIADTATVHIVLNGANLTCSSSAPIYVKQADKAIVTLASGTVNTLTDTENYIFETDENTPHAPLYSNADLTLNGSGTLQVYGNYQNGISTKDDLIITNGTYEITATHNGIRGKDSVSINGGIFTIIAGADGIKSNHSTDTEKGRISIDGGTFAIDAVNDAIQAETKLQITGGTFQISTNGGSANAPEHAEEHFGGFAGGTPEQWADGEMPTDFPAGGNGEMPAFEGEMPEDWNRKTPPDMSTFTPPNDIPVTTTTETSAEEEETESAKGIKAGTQIVITDGTFTIDTYDDALHTNGNLYIFAGTYTILSGDDGIHADETVSIYGGTIDINYSYEGVEGAHVYIYGGNLAITASDDGINAAGGASDGTPDARPQDNFSASGDYSIQIDGGTVIVHAKVDGVDSNGDIVVNGGLLIIDGQASGNIAGDGALDFDGELTVSGGTIIATGYYGAATIGQAAVDETNSTQPIFEIYFDEVQTAGTLVNISDASGNSIYSFTSDTDYQCFFISDTSLEIGTTYYISVGGTATSEVVTGLYNGTYAEGNLLTEVTLETIKTSINQDGSAHTGQTGGFGGRPNGVSPSNQT